MNNIKNILFDLDGTISDSREGILNGIRYSAKELNLQPELDIPTLEKFIGPPLHHSYEAKFNLTEAEAAHAVSVFRQYYERQGWSENTVIKNIPETLAALKAQGYNLYVATSKPTVYAKKIIKHFGLDNYFIEIAGSNLDNSRSDKAEIIQHLVDAHQLKSEETLMIGDTKFDIQGAQKHNTCVVAITSGTDTRAELQQYQPDLIIDDALELLEILKSDATEFEIIAFSHPESIEKEAQIINQLFENGLHQLVIRKPKWNDEQFVDLLAQIDANHHPKLFICDRIALVLSNNVKGLHCSNAFYDSMTKIEQHQLQYDLQRKHQQMSISVHNEREWQKRAGKFHQLYLSPIFESVSKPGYKGNWNVEELPTLLQQMKTKEKIIALGGIQTKNIQQVEQIKFDGAAALGLFWNEPEKAMEALIELKAAL